jgi:hypothetical protein
MSESTALAVLPTADLPTILAADKDDILGKLAKEIAAFRPDVSTPAGRTAIGAMGRKVGSAKMDLVRLANQLTEDWRKSTAAVVAERKILETKMDALRKQVEHKLTEFEAREKQRVADHQAALNLLAAWPQYPDDWTADQIETHLGDLATHDLLRRDWQEFSERAADTYAAVRDTLNSAIARARRQEAEAAELAKLRAEAAERERQAEKERQHQRDLAIAAAAAETARKVAQAEAVRVAQEAAEAAQAALDAAARREREALEAQAAAERRAELAEADRVARHRLAISAIRETPGYGSSETAFEISKRIWRLEINLSDTDWEEFAAEAEAETKAEIARMDALHHAAKAREDAAREKAEEELRAAAKRREEAAAAAALEADRQRRQREADAQAEIDRKRAANQKHRAAINRAVRDALMAHAGLSELTATEVVKAIASEKVPHVRISYSDAAVQSDLLAMQD